MCGLVASAIHSRGTSCRSPQRPPRSSSSPKAATTVFKRQFTAAVGKPPITYLLDLRLTRATRLLRETTAPLAVIARQVGYSSEYALGRVPPQVRCGTGPLP
jgi:methylphosphotriester-DNA--protein-cysteine methyltransferase